MLRRCSGVLEQEGSWHWVCLMSLFPGRLRLPLHPRASPDPTRCHAAPRAVTYAPQAYMSQMLFLLAPLIVALMARALFK